MTVIDLHRIQQFLPCQLLFFVHRGIELPLGLLLKELFNFHVLFALSKILQQLRTLLNFIEIKGCIFGDIHCFLLFHQSNNKSVKFKCGCYVFDLGIKEIFNINHNIISIRFVMQGGGEKQRIESTAQKFNLEKGLIANLVKSEPATQKAFFDVITYSGLEHAEKKVGNMLYSIATKLPITIERFRKALSQWVGSNEISNPNQLDYTIQYLKSAELKGGAQLETLKKDCGVGLKLTNEEIKAIIQTQIATANQKSKKFQFLGKVKEQIPFVEGKVLKDLFEESWKAKGLPDNVPVQKEKKQKVQKKNEEAAQEVFHIKDISELIGREMRSAVNSKELLQDRINKFGDIVLTRFPPEPNGYLHIGHCKAMRFNFMQARISKGKCYLRFDDTNPTKENIEYIENIKENINFMGYEPWKITHASDNFQLLHAYAIQLIKQGDAFVCSQPTEEMRRKRGEGLPSKDRDRSVQENLRLFEQMRLGLHEEGAFSLRAKIDCKHANTTMRDPVIYRIKFHSHPHVGDKWCIYPLYDYTHPICDSFEGITHSLCSLQFQIRRELYYWTLQRLNIYRPHVWEYSRLNITYTVLSKRKLHELIFTNRVSGWDDPRILTINGMRRRGYPAEAINNFCDAIGVTRRGNENYINFGVLENEVRKYLDAHAPRTMAVLDPVELIIEGLQEQTLTVPLFPKEQQKGSRTIKFASRIWVQRSDIKLQDQKGFYGIAPQKVVGLKYASTIFIKEVKHNNGVITQVIAEVDKNKTKPNSYLSWIAIDESFNCEVRNYGLLFNCQRPGDADDYLNFLNPLSLQKHEGVKVHKDILKDIKLTDRYQFQRKGFYCLDKDTDLANNKIVWNLTVGLVDNRAKK